jgi:hypothetical protein
MLPHLGQHAFALLIPSDFVVRRCFRSVDSSSDCYPKFVAIDEEAQYQIVHRCHFRETNRATREPLDPGP